MGCLERPNGEAKMMAGVLCWAFYFFSFLSLFSRSMGRKALEGDRRRRPMLVMMEKKVMMEIDER